MTLNQALDFEMTEKKASLAPKTFQDYNCVNEFAKQAATALGIAGMPIGNFRRKHMKLLLSKIGETKAGGL